MYSLLPFTTLFSILWSHNVELIQGELLWKQVGDDIDGEAEGDESGSSVAMSDDGSRIAIGAPYNSGNGANSGHVRVYDLFEDAWTQVGDDIDGEAENDWSGSSVAMSGDGARIAIGAPSNDGNVRIYEFEDSWTKVGDIDGEASCDNSGESVAMSGDGTRIAIGAPYHDGGNRTESGHVRVYQFEETSWDQLGNDIDGVAEDDYSGSPVAMSGDGTRIAIGAPYHDGGNDTNSGHVRVYQFGETSWDQLGNDIDGVAELDYSGSSVAMSRNGTRIIIGAPYHDGGNGTNSGHVRVYQFGETSWDQLGNDIDGVAEFDYSGRSVAMSGDGARIAIGAPNHDDNGNDNDIGHVRVYEFGDSWKQVGDDIDGEASYDYSGDSVAMSDDGSRIIIGAQYANGSCSGHVRVFQLVARCGLYSDLQTKFCRGRANWDDKFPIFWTASLDKNQFKNKECNTNVCEKSECCLTGPQRTCANTGKKGLVCGGFTKKMCGNDYKLKSKKKRAKTPCTGRNGARCTVMDCCVTTNPK